MGLNRLRTLAGYFGTGLVSGAVLSAFNLWTQAEADPLHSALEGDGHYYPYREGRIFYKVDGDGPPLVLLHGTYMAASGWELRKQHAFFAENEFTVYTPDLLGYGLSTRPAIRYSADMFIDLIHAFVRDVVGEPAVVMASTQTAGLTVAAAARNPELFGALVLIEPTGVGRHDRRPVWGALAEEVLRLPGIGQALFNVFISKPMLTWYAIRQLYLDDTNVTDEVLDYYYSVSHQPNARFAPAAHMGGAFNRSIRDEFAALRVPTLLVWGYQSTDVPPTDGPTFLQTNPRATMAGFDAKLLPHDEAADDFNKHVLRWLRRQAETAERTESLELRVVL